MRKAMEAIKPILSEPYQIQVVSAASATSAYDLGLDMTVTPTTLQSTEEVNATPTSFSSFGPAVIGSTAQATISGEYDGSNGTDTLTFRVSTGGTHGVDDLQIKVYDSSSQQINQINILADDPIDRKYTLSSGLVLTLGHGELLRDTSFTVDVSDRVGSAVDPDKNFNGIRNDNPNLEYGLSVGNGFHPYKAVPFVSMAFPSTLT